ncbi:hypothetical protein HPB48_004992 [Haemaphysalis longicornis]|uniref:Uncharacterized protein n=1 Tax=Haemaphysalis longicornis TaxID=44386 RepID=A0A9J6GEM7_HAELO|nr:hypothetical protein HPB48_004992 [Haemaphysalis longicornis]
MVKAAWSEVTATCVWNCFRSQSGGGLWQRVSDSDMRKGGGDHLDWDDFVCADEDADTAEPCTDEGIVNEVRGKSDAEESDADDDKLLSLRL